MRKRRYQRDPSQSSAQRFIKQRAVQTELLQVAVWESDISRQRQPLIYVLREDTKYTHTRSWMFHCSAHLSPTFWSSKPDERDFLLFNAQYNNQKSLLTSETVTDSGLKTQTSLRQGVRSKSTVNNLKLYSIHLSGWINTPIYCTSCCRAVLVWLGGKQ